MNKILLIHPEIDSTIPLNIVPEETTHWSITSINELTKPIELKLRKQGSINFNDKSGEYETVAKADKEMLDKYGKNYFFKFQKKVLERFGKYYSGKLLIFSFIDELTGLPKLLINEFVSKNKNFTLVNNLFDYWGNQSYQLYDKHPNTLGHQKIAEALFKYILDHFLINCRELQSR